MVRDWDIWTGDCVGYLRDLSPGFADAAITDPPYLVKYRGARGTNQTILGDSDDAWVRPFYRELYRVLKDDALAVTFYGWPRMDTFLRAIKDAGFRVVSQLVFIKNQMGLGYYTRGKHEQALLLAKGRPPYPHPAPPDVFPFTRVRKARHPNHKPQDALLPLVELVSQPGDLILDPFCGSGSTGEAALALSRRFLGIDLDPRHAASARAHLEVLVSADCTTKPCRTRAHPGTV